MENTVTERAHRNSAMRWLLVCAVALGLVTMHHIAGQHSGDPAPTHVAPQSAAAAQVLSPQDSADRHEQAPSPAHDTASMLFHLCLAVLAGSAVLLVSITLSRSRWQTAARLVAADTGGVRGRPPPSAPPRPPRGFAYDLCVLRL
ncbi:hypothetical protein FFT09_02165 [Saccharomonospora piscinae]|nr:hypothetical protein FFT09_02165 [Saccharomonospora piscinae]